MEYRIKRGQEEFGPYTLTDLQTYLQSGDLLPDDLVLSEGMAEAAPLREVLGDIPAATEAVPEWGGEDPRIVQLPPNLHWALVLVLSIVTRSLFTEVWIILQAYWAHKLSGKNTALVLSVISPAALFCGVLAIGFGQYGNILPLLAVGSVIFLGSLVCRIMASFAIRDAMEEYYNTVENVGLMMGPVMTFFFGAIYIQYQINSIARWKKTGVMS